MENEPLTQIEQRILDMTIATGRICLLGRDPSTSVWLAACDGMECQGSTANSALDRLTTALTQRATTINKDAIIDAKEAKEQVRSTGVLLDHLREHTEQPE